MSLNHLTEIILLAFADDIVLLADSAVKMKKILRAPHKYCQLNKLNINIKKTKIIIFRKGGHGHDKKYDSFFYEKNKIEIVSNYVYLGIPFSNSAVFLNAANKAVTKTKLALSTTTSLIEKLKLNNWYPVRKLFISLIISVLM